MTEQNRTSWFRIPPQLRALRQWCPAGSDKSPMMANGRRASVIDPGTWGDFETACRIADFWNTAPGLVLTADDPFTVIDLDVRDNTTSGQIAVYQKIIETFDSYTEHSKSGRGWHVIIEGKIGRGRRRGGVEIYSQEHFIICTGKIVRDRPIAVCPELLSRLLSEMPPPVPELELQGENIPDWALAQRAVEDLGEFGRLFRGEWQGRHYPSQSEADLALVTMLLAQSDSPLECWNTFLLSTLGQRAKARRRGYARSTLALAAYRLASEAARTEHGRQIAERLSSKA